MLSLSLGPFSLPVDTALTFFSLALFLAATHWFGRKNLDRAWLNDGAFYAIVIGFITARIVFVAQLWEVYQVDWLSIIDVRDGGFSKQFGWYAGVIALVLFAHNKRDVKRVYFQASAFALLCALPLYVWQSIAATKPSVPTSSVATIEGNTVSLSTFSGKPIVLNLWASWCPPCRREMPVLARAQQNQPDIAFVFVNQQESPKQVSDFLRTHDFVLNNSYLDYTGQVASELGAYGLPTTLFFDHKGELIGNHVGEVSAATLAHYLTQFESVE